jgi:hypothetical protein
MIKVIYFLGYCLFKENYEGFFFSTYLAFQNFNHKCNTKTISSQLGRDIQGYVLK